MRIIIPFLFRLISLVFLVIGNSEPLRAGSPLEARIAFTASLQIVRSAWRWCACRSFWIERTSGGKIDGREEVPQKAADRYCRANNLSLGTLLDVSDISEPYREYVITDEDLQWIGPQAGASGARKS